MRSARRAGITLFDTAPAYTPPGRAHHNEHLLARTLTGRAVVATKGGHFRDGDTFRTDGRPATLRAHCDASLAALGVDRIDLYFLHWPDPGVPIEESVGALAELRRAGKIRQIGVSNLDRAQLDRACRAAPIAAVQNRLSVFDQRHAPMARYCAEMGMAFLAYSPLGGPGGALADREPPRRLAEIARIHGALPAQVALAWLLALAPTVIPIVGASRPSHVRSAVEATELCLTAAESGELSNPGPGRTTIRLDRPRGAGWRASARLVPEVESTATSGGDPPDWVQIVLRPGVDEHRVRSIVRTLADGLSAGSGDAVVLGHEDAPTGL